MGTSGTMTGTGIAIKKLNPHVHRVGVTTQPGDRVPGPRSEALLAPVIFPWRDSIDAMEWVGSKDAYTLSLKLCRNGLLVGPSSGFNLQGLLQHLGKLKEEGRLDSLRHPARGDGLINAVFLCCDGPFQYIDEYPDKVGASEFPEIEDDILLDVDKYRYDDAWELLATDAVSRFDLQLCQAQARLNEYKTEQEGKLIDSAVDLTASGMSSPSISSRSTSLGSLFESTTLSSPATSGPPSPTSGSRTIVIDLRDRADQIALRQPVFSVPLASLAAHRDTCPFTDAKVLREQWLELNPLFSAQHEGLPADLRAQLTCASAKELDVVFLCYNGNTSRIATSIARNAGYNAWCIAGGSVALAATLS